MPRRPKPVRLDLWGHLAEARGRLLHGLMAVLTASLAFFWFREPVFAWLAAPAGPLHYLGPADAILAQLKVSLALGFLTALPLLAWLAWGFFAPALEAGPARRLAWALAAGVGLFWLGAFLGWLLLGQGLKFLAAYALPGLQPFYSVDRYLSFLFSLALGCGVVFELPVAVYWLARQGLLTRADLLHRWREALVAILVLAALLTPSPDAFTQLLLALPLAGLYGASIAVAGWAAPKQDLLPRAWRPGP